MILDIWVLPPVDPLRREPAGLARRAASEYVWHTSDGSEDGYATRMDE
jgi:hypothetical protein